MHRLRHRLSHPICVDLGQAGCDQAVELGPGREEGLVGRGGTGATGVEEQYRKEAGVGVVLVALLEVQIPLPAVDQSLIGSGVGALHYLYVDPDLLELGLDERRDRPVNLGRREPRYQGEFEPPTILLQYAVIPRLPSRLLEQTLGLVWVVGEAFD